ncbi:serine/threonine protein kinase [Candidatus Uabimicrobium amorphum]|uniref:non-specific serine/threonine protein kinase n=1 Tax=Uabimicrobium amorphum TaxID=2596890 RepID=A0A5S9II20_UABAM|nr:serine/threonine-protein kinase [Candidatus Uabimicrobium amorphum]BBM82218.1 protein kinase [Candidatus Uabimicrobium amorphum]
MSGHKTRKISKNDLQQKENVFSLSQDMIEGILNVANSEHSQEHVQENELIVNRYRIIKKLGEGGMGMVYQVKDEHLDNQIVAIKVTIAEAGDSHTNTRFSREIEMMRQLQHPNIMKVYDAGKHHSHLFYTMEYIEGKPFYEFLWQNFTINKGVEIIIKVAQAVHFAHENSIVHRDLKPDNIMITNDLRPILMDFGIAKIVESHTQLTKSGFVMGTPFYMSPEQALGSEVDHLSDVYALGVILYEFITGSLPFTGKSNKETLSAVVNDLPQSPMAINLKVDERLNDICLKALSKNKKNRHVSAREFAMELEKYLHDNGTINSDKRKWLLLTNVIILIILALLVYYFTL